MNNEGLDKLDIAILDILKDNARLSYSEIGEKVGVSRISVRKRMEALSGRPVILSKTLAAERAAAILKSSSEE